MKIFFSMNKGFGAPKPSYTIEISLSVQILHASNKGFTLQDLVLWCFKMKILRMPIHLWIMWNKPRQSNDDMISWGRNDIENNVANVGTNGKI
jgi:hypothetical protein